jgi:hypothetical protein
MNHPFEIISVLSGDNPDEKKQIVEALEKLYFGHIRAWWKLIRLSETYRIAEDIIKLDDNLRKNQSITSVRLKSDQLSNNDLLREAKRLEKVPDPTSKRLYDEVINPNRFNIKTIIIADILQQERKAVAMSRVRNILLGIVSIVGAIISILLGVILQNAK